MFRFRRSVSRGGLRGATGVHRPDRLPDYLSACVGIRRARCERGVLLGDLRKPLLELTERLTEPSFVNPGLSDPRQLRVGRSLPIHACPPEIKALIPACNSNSSLGFMSIPIISPIACPGKSRRCRTTGAPEDS